MQRLAIALLTSLVAAGCSDSPRDYEPIATLVAKADTVTLYEGLPREGGEDELLKQELAEKKTFEFGGYPFYAEPMPLSKEDAAVLTAIFDGRDALSDEPPGGNKCGGFHPDFAVEWENGEDVARVQICIGCHEIKAFSKTTELWLSLSDQAVEKLRTLLKDRWQHRPKSRVSEMWRH